MTKAFPPLSNATPMTDENMDKQYNGRPEDDAIDDSTIQEYPPEVLRMIIPLEVAANTILAVTMEIVLNLKVVETVMPPTPITDTGVQVFPPFIVFNIVALSPAAIAMRELTLDTAFKLLTMATPLLSIADCAIHAEPDVDEKKMTPPFPTANTVFPSTVETALSCVLARDVGVSVVHTVKEDVYEARKTVEKDPTAYARPLDPVDTPNKGALR